MINLIFLGTQDYEEKYKVFFLTENNEITEEAVHWKRQIDE